MRRVTALVFHAPVGASLGERIVEEARRASARDLCSRLNACGLDPIVVTGAELIRAGVFDAKTWAPPDAEEASFHFGRVLQRLILESRLRPFSSQMEVAFNYGKVQMLNDMFHDLTPIVLKFEGTVDKYIGDAILAVFGCPEPDEQQWEHAVRAALEMQAAVKRLGTGRWKGRPAFRIGIGIHTGPVIHGFIGAAERMEYTVIGDTINGASRYCDAAASEEILISPSTFAHLHHCVEVDLPPRMIDTKHEGKMKAYLVRGRKGKRAI